MSASNASFAQFVKYLNTDPKFFYASPEALLVGYRDIAKRIDPELSGLALYDPASLADIKGALA